MSETFSVTLSIDQANVLVQLLNVAVKSVGLEVAAHAVALHNHIQAAHAAAFTPVSKANTITQTER